MMPETGEQTPGGVELTPEAFMQEFGFKNLSEAKTAMSKYKTDLTTYKGEARTARELADKLAAFENAERARQDKELTETQKLAARLADMEKTVAERDARIAAKDREILTERVFSSRLNGRTPEESAVLRRLLSSAVAGQTFADEAELAELLKPVETEYEMLRSKFGAAAGPGIGQTGSPASKQGSLVGAVKDYLNMSRREQMEHAFEQKKGR